MKNPVLIYRWIVFLLAAGYCLRTLIFSDWSHFAGPLRFLTIWALFCSFFCASRMMALMEGRSTARWDGFVSMTAVLNGMVVVLFWRLYFEDPFSVTRDGTLSEWYLEVYLHGLGPLLQWIDALFFHRAFRRPVRAVAWLLGTVATYLAWIEFVVQPLNASPRGSVTTGLPYPFLNSLRLEDRLATYGTYVVGALVLLAIFTALGWLVSALLRRREGLAGRTGSPGSAG